MNGFDRLAVAVEEHKAKLGDPKSMLRVLVNHSEQIAEDPASITLKVNPVVWELVKMLASSD